MVNKQGKVIVWLIPVLFAIALCMSAFAFLLPLTAKAEETTTTYDVTGITVSSTAENDNAIYADATVPENVDKTWGINYQGNATLNGEAKTINLRVIGAPSNLYFVDIGAKEGDILIVGGTYSMSGIDSSAYSGATQLGDYALKLEQTAFKNYGNGVWDVVSDATSYDVVPLKKADIECSASNFYADSAALDNNAIVNSWHNQYKGVAKKNGKATWVTFRFVENDRLWFENLNAAADDVFNFGGVYSAVPLDSDATVTRGQYLINLSDISFKWSGSDWVLIEPEKTTVDEAFEDSVVLDADYTNVWLTIDGVKQTSVALDTICGIFSGATGSTKVIFTNNAVQSGGTIRVDLAKKYKASNYSALRVRMVVGSWNNTANAVVTSAYATSDTAFASIAGSVETKDQENKEVILEVDALKIADADGYIDSFVLKRVGPSGQIYFDYVELVPAKGKVDDMPEENVFLDANGTDVWLTGNDVAVQDNTVKNNWWGFFTPSAENAKVSFRDSAITDGGTLQINLGKKYKASNFATVNVKILVGVAAGVTNTAYATNDTTFTTPAGAASTTGATEAITLEIDASKIADSEGYIDSFVIRRTGSAGQLFVDYVELILDRKDDTVYAEDLVLGINGTDAKFSDSDGYYTADANAFWDETKQKIIGVMNNTGNNTVMTFILAKKYKAANFESVTIEYCVSDWTSADNKITIAAYALSDTDCVTLLASHTVNGMANTKDSLTISAEALAGSDGYIKGIILKKTQTVLTYTNADGIEVPANWQFFANEITLNVPSYKMAITDGDNVVTQRVVKGESFAVADIGVVNNETQIVAGYKINGKLYSADYSFTPSADTAIEVIRVAFKVKDGGAIKYIGDMGLRFTALLGESEYNALKAIVSEENVSFGIDLTKVSTKKTVSRIATNYYTNEDGEISYNGVILNIPTTAYEEEFTANAYLEIKYEDKENTVKIYAIANDNTRSVYRVAKNALEKGVTGQIEAVCEEIVSAVEASKTNLPDYDSKKKMLELVISGWLIPSTLSEENVSWIKEAGIDSLFAMSTGIGEDGADSTIHFDDYTDNAEKVLNLLNENGVKVYINSAVASKEKIALFNHDAVLGVVIDEPDKAQIDELAEQVEYYNANANGKTVYVNLFPSHAPTVTNDFNGSYEEYLKYFCDNFLAKLTTGEKWLSVDRYPLTYDASGNKCLDTGWLADVQAVATVAKSYNGVKTNFFIQTMPFGTTDGAAKGSVDGSRDRVPTIEDIRLQEMALMSFGFDGISMFCYASPSVIENGEFTSGQVAMIDRNGNKTDIYTAVKTATEELKNFDHVLLQFNYQSTITNDAGKTASSSDTDSTTTNESFKKLDRVNLSAVGAIKSVYTSQDTLFGYFKDENGNDGFTVVNYNDTSKGLTDTIEITFDTETYDTAVYYERGVKKIAKLENGKLSLTLGVGEGIFVIPCHSK